MATILLRPTVLSDDYCDDCGPSIGFVFVEGEAPFTLPTGYRAELKWDDFGPYSIVVKCRECNTR